MEEIDNWVNVVAGGRVVVVVDDWTSRVRQGVLSPPGERRDGAVLLVEKELPASGVAEVGSGMSL